MALSAVGSTNTRPVMCYYILNCGNACILSIFYRSMSL